MARVASLAPTQEVGGSTVDRGTQPGGRTASSGYSTA